MASRGLVDVPASRARRRWTAQPEKRFKVDSAVPNPADSYSTSSIAIRGTIGYVAPECATGVQVSSTSDVYSFGIVLLEIFLQKRPIDDMFKDGLKIAKFVEMNFPARIAQIIDPELLQDPAATKDSYWEFLVSMLNIGLCCTKFSPNERPIMQEVAQGCMKLRSHISEGTKLPSIHTEPFVDEFHSACGDGLHFRKPYGGNDHQLQLEHSIVTLRCS